jgi:anti-sigma-K factor RskA
MWSMTEDDDIDGLAAEYVLGSLDPADRAQVDARRRTDASLAAAVDAWQRRLAPLSDLVPGEVPPPHLFERILSQIPGSGESADATKVTPFRTRPGRRVVLAIAPPALAACLMLAVTWRTHTTPPGEPSSIDVAFASCGNRYKDFWATFDQQKYARVPAEKLAGLSRMALRAYDACQAGDNADSNDLFDRLQKIQT